MCTDGTEDDTYDTEDGTIDTGCRHAVAGQYQGVHEAHVPETGWSGGWLIAVAVPRRVLPQLLAHRPGRSRARFGRSIPCLCPWCMHEEVRACQQLVHRSEIFKIATICARTICEADMPRGMQYDKEMTWLGLYKGLCMCHSSKPSRSPQ
jgi:hypothetical protein